MAKAARRAASSNMDYDKVIERIGARLREILSEGRRRVAASSCAMSGGIDSSVSSALCVKALGPDKRVRHHAAGARFLGLQHRARQTARRAPRHPLRGVRHRAGARRHRLLPVARRRHSPRVPGIRRRLEEQDRHHGRPRRPHQPLRARGADARRRIEDRRACRCREYLQIVAATNHKQRIRKTVEYFHADRLNYAVIGTPNRLEYDQGFFVKNGDGSADVKPIAHLYKSAGVRAGAAHEAARGNLRGDADHRHLQPRAGPGRVLFRAALCADGSRAVGAQPRLQRRGAGAPRSKHHAKRRRRTCSTTSKPSARATRYMHLKPVLVEP